MNCVDIHKNAEEELLSVFQRLVHHGENNSALLIGPRGSGKTFLLKQTLAKLSHDLKENDHQNSSSSSSNDLIVINLSGCLCSDDKSALLEISRQMQLENVINDKVFGSFSDSFEFLLRSFRVGDKQCKPLIFIMDEFDLFTKNKSQLLLYTILNTLQHSPSPMCLIGLTCRIDVLDLLEKRIKSRFSHRQIYLFNDYSFDKYLELSKFFIQQHQHQHQHDQNQDSSSSRSSVPFLDKLFDDPSVLKLLSRLYECDKSMAALKRVLMLPALKLAESSSSLESVRTELDRSFRLWDLDAKFVLLRGLSILELTLTVVMLEMSEIYVDEPFNFDLIYNSYLKFLQKKNWFHQKQERQVILKAYEHLIALKFILPALDSGGTSVRRGKDIKKEHLLMYLALDKREVELCIAQYPNCPTELSLASRVY